MNESTSLERVETQPNPFARQLDERLNAGTVAIESQRAVAEVQAAMLIAKKFPRNQAQAWEQVMETCKRKEFAESASYSFPRGRETVSGPSIRLAEELARAWGNIEFGIRELAVYEDGTEVEAYCWDVEQNTRSKQTFRVPHERHTRQGVTKLSDPRDIYEQNANMGARRLRSRILAIIPPDMVAAAERQCKETRLGRTDTPLAVRVQQTVAGFAKLQISVAHIERRLGHGLDSILPDEFDELLTIYHSLKDGMTQASDWFAVSKSSGSGENASKIDGLLSGAKPAPILSAPEMIQEIETAWLEKGLNDVQKVKAIHEATGKSVVLTSPNLDDSDIRKIWEAVKKSTMS
jgi:hypothetical protein